MVFEDSGLPRPGKVIAVHINYPSRAAERGRTPALPSYFLKPASSIAASGATVERPAGTELLGFEGEIALVIGTAGRRIAPEQAWAHVAWVTASNDLGVYDLRWADKGSNVRSKGGDGFTPLGPELIDARMVDPRALRIRTWLDGALVQDDTTADLLFPFETLVADLSQLLTLEPGDVILTGTPAGASVARPGQVIEVEVDAPTAAAQPTSGRLTTTVVEGTAPLAVGAQPRVDDLQRTEAWGTREAAGLPAEFELDADLAALLRSVSTATLSSQLRKRGYDDVSIDGVRASKPGQRMVGRARTLRFVPFRPDLFAAHGGGFNAQKRAFDGLHAGDVLVIEARGVTETGTVGDILALRAQVLGAAGVVTDGGIRDFAAVAAMDLLPTWSAGPHPAVLGRRHVPWDVDGTIACGGAVVQPGDVVVGDDDGVLVIPPALVREVAEAAVEQEREERFITEQVARGESVDGLYPVDERWRARRDAWEPSDD